MNKPLLVLLCLIFFSFAAYSQNCTLNVTISSLTTAICSGSSVKLTANAAGGTGPYTYIWSTGENTESIDVNKAGTYTVTVSDKTPGCQAKVATIPITAITSPNPPTVANQIVCPNTTATLTPTGPGGTYQWYDANGAFLFTGPSYTTDPITENTFYYVETTVGSCTSTRSMVIVYVTGKPSIQADPVCYGTAATLIASGADSYAWYDNASGTGTPLSTSSSFTTPNLIRNTPYYLVAIIRGCTGTPILVTARVNQPPASPTVTANNSVCAGSPITLHADAAAGVIQWFDVPSGGTPLISSPDYTTPSLNSPAIYYVQAVVGDCQSSRVAVPVSVTPIPQAPAAQTQSTCYNTSITLTADVTPTGTYAWYTTATGGIAIKTSNTFQTPLLTSNTTYYVQHINGSCVSDRTPVTVTVNQPVTPPTVPDGPIICNGSPVSLTASSTGGGTFQWFTAAIGGTAISADATLSIPSLTATTTYYVQTTQAGCISDRSSVTVTVLDAIPSPVVSPAVVICSGSAATITATGSPDDYEWYDQPTGGTLLVTGNTYVTPALTANATYYVQSIANDCSSPRIAVPVQVNSPPVAPNISGNSTVCPGASATLNVAAATGETTEWFSEATGGNPLFTGNSYTTDPLFAQTTFYAQVSNGSCVSTRAAFTVSVTQVLGLQFKYPSGTNCISGPNVKPVIFNPDGGVFTSNPAGLVFVDNATGEINVGASAVGKYTIIFSYGGTCPGLSSQDLSIVIAPDARFSYAGPFCQGDKNPLPVFLTGASTGVFSASSTQLVFKNTSTGEIDLDASKNGTYTITNTINASCGQSVATATVTINQKVTVIAGPTQTVQQGTPVQLAGIISGGTTSGHWTGGAGSFSNPTDKRAVYTPTPDERVVTLTLISNDPAGPCGIQSAKVTININPVPPAPTAAGKSVCMGSTATLVASAPGGTYRWYSEPTGGSILKTGPIFITPPVTADITYYVETTVGSINSARTAVPVKAIATPQPPQVVPGPVCWGTSAILTATGSTGTYAWFDVPVGGNPISQTNPFTTTQLTGNRTYYVQTTVDGCTSTRTKVEVVVTPAPNVTSGNGDVVCSGTALNYTLTADQPGTVFSWGRASIANISNAAVSGQTSNTITETLINTSGAAVDVTYVITPILNGCQGPAFNYVVTVNALPVVISPLPPAVCNGTSTLYQVKFNTDATSFTWSRAAVQGISNAAVSGQAAPTIKEVLFNTTNAPIDVTYVFNFKTSSCAGLPYELKVTVNPEPVVTDDINGGTICNNVPLGHTISSNISSAKYMWSRAAVTGISNAAAVNQTDNPINETLINTATVPVRVNYVITPIAYDCSGKSFQYTLLVNPQTAQRQGNSNSPVCEGHSILLLTAAVPGAQYLWTGPNNYQSTQQNPIIPNATAADAGTYSLSIIISGCASDPTPVHVEVNPKPIVSAGADVTKCITVTSIQLDGSVISAANTGVWTGGNNGRFSALDDLKAQYFPSQADKDAGFVKLKLTATGRDDCDEVSSEMTITFGPAPGADAGPPSIDNICIQSPSVQLNGQVYSGTGVKWISASGKGNFIPSANVLNPVFQPDATDVAKGSIKLTLTATDADECHTPSDDITINFSPPPIVMADAAGSTRYVLRGHTITLNPVISSENVTYEWTPGTNLSSTTIKNPVVTGDQDQLYQLVITDKSNGCTNHSEVTVKVAPTLSVNNTFTPNGDGTNDYWEITGLIAYESATVNVYNRYGQPVFHSVGYPKPWDGSYKGQTVTPGTYYYVIDTKINGLILSGYVVVLK